MPIYKRCSRCMQRVLEGTVCGCRDRRYYEEDKYKKDSKEDSFYQSKEWKGKRAVTASRFDYIDIYSLYKYGFVEEGEVVHHIMPLKDDWLLRLDDGNLIYLTERNHRKIHTLMEQSPQQYKQIIAELQGMLKRYEDEYRAGGSE